MARTIKVQAGEKIGAGEVAFWETDPAHPAGEAYVVNRSGKSYRVGMTPGVQKALGEQRLAMADDDDDDASVATQEAVPKRAPARRTPPLKRPESPAAPASEAGGTTSEAGNGGVSDDGTDGGGDTTASQADVGAHHSA